MASIRVVCRFRPQNKIELGQGGKSIINLDPSGGTVKIKVQFDKIFSRKDLMMEIIDILVGV